MFEYISGNIAELTPTQVVVECSGIGFCLNISLNTYTALQGKGSAKLYVYEAVREDAFTLYGFDSKEERKMFLLLISVSGVGAGTARMILSSVSVPELRNAVLSGNEYVLKGVKGIGLKTAQRIIVDLKDKVSDFAADGSVQTAGATANSEVAEEAVQALVMLGFGAPAVKKAVQKIISEQPAATVEQIIKQALKMM